MENQYEVIKGFKGSPNGYDVVDYQAGEKVSLPDDLAKVAIAEKWVKKPKGAPSDAAALKAQTEKLNKAIGALTTNLEKASDDDKPTIQAQIEAKQAELRELTDE